MEAEREMNQREEELFEQFTIIHLLCILILFLSFVLDTNMFISDNIYPAIDLRLFLSISFLTFGAVLLYNARNSMHQTNSKFFSWVDFAYITFPLLVAVIILFAIQNNSYLLKTILILPVLVAASVKGKKAGMVMSTACVSILLLNQVVTGADDSLLRILESELIFISILYVVGWLVGVTTELEAKNREQLETSLLSLREEIDWRKRVEEQLRKLTRAVEESPSIIIITDTKGEIEYVNNRFTQITGYLPEIIIGKNMRELYSHSPETYALIWEAINSGKEWQGESYKRKNNGSFYWEQASISPFKSPEGKVTHFLYVGEDITEHKQIREEMARLDQLNLVGEMAAGMGHEVRNPMTVVRGFLQVLGNKKDCQQYKEYYDLMIEELDRANSIISEFLTLSKNKAVEKKLMNLNQILKPLFSLIEADAVKKDNPIQLEQGDIPDLHLDEKEIRQVVLNLVRNGLDAMSPGGILTIRTYVDGDEVVLSVQDQGKGIEPGVLEKIGTPFFTTKDYGTGLGLAVCYSITARHNATMKFESGSGGTTVSIRFKTSNTDG